MPFDCMTRKCFRLHAADRCASKVQASPLVRSHHHMGSCGLQVEPPARALTTDPAAPLAEQDRLEQRKRRYGSASSTLPSNGA